MSEKDLRSVRIFNLFSKSFFFFYLILIYTFARPFFQEIVIFREIHNSIQRFERRFSSL